LPMQAKPALQPLDEKVKWTHLTNANIVGILTVMLSLSASPN
jgi:hypothetical protein